MKYCGGSETGEGGGVHRTFEELTAALSSVLDDGKNKWNQSSHSFNTFIYYSRQHCEQEFLILQSPALLSDNVPDEQWSQSRMLLFVLLWMSVRYCGVTDHHLVIGAGWGQWEDLMVGGTAAAIWENVKTTLPRCWEELWSVIKAIREHEMMIDQLLVDQVDSPGYILNSVLNNNL